MNITVQARHATDVQHAVFAIVRNLSILKLHTWCPVLLLWLAQYEGLETYLDPDESPPIAIRDLLARYIATGEHVFPKKLVIDLSSLAFVRYRAALTEDSRTQWDPRLSSFIEFAQRGDVSVWLSEAPLPSLCDIQDSLLYSYMHQQAGDRHLYLPFISNK